MIIQIFKSHGCYSIGFQLGFFTVTLHNFNLLRSIFYVSPQPKPKKRSFWLVSAPRFLRRSHAATNRSLLFEILTITEARYKAKDAVTDALNDLVHPFYTSIQLPTASENTLKSRAKGLYDRYRRLTTLKVESIFRRKLI